MAAAGALQPKLAWEASSMNEGDGEDAAAAAAPVEHVAGK